MALRAKRTRKSSDESVGKAAKAPAKRASAKHAPAKRSKPPAAKKTAAGAGANDGRARLEAELKDAKARIAELEKLNEEAVNRIDWVIDSLQTVLAEKD